MGSSALKYFVVFQRLLCTENILATHKRTHKPRHTRFAMRNSSSLSNPSFRMVTNSFSLSQATSHTCVADEDDADPEAEEEEEDEEEEGIEGEEVGPLLAGLRTTFTQEA